MGEKKEGVNGVTYRRWSPLRELSSVKGKDYCGTQPVEFVWQLRAAYCGCVAATPLSGPLGEVSDLTGFLSLGLRHW